MLLLYVMKCLIFSGIMGIIKKVVCGHRIIQLLINIQRAKRDEVSYDEHIRIKLN